jgi:hypothetical protein
MIRPFSLRDLDDLFQIEKQSFPKSPYDWATFVNLHFLYPETFLVYVDDAGGKKKKQILGYIIFAKEGHILSTVHPLHRRRDRKNSFSSDDLPIRRVRRGQKQQGAQDYFI